MMSTDKVRRVTKKRDTEEWDTWAMAHVIGSEWVTDPNGTHMLVPVEVWERVVEELGNIAEHQLEHDFHARGRYGYPALIKKARRALAEIGGKDEG